MTVACCVLSTMVYAYEFCDWNPLYPCLMMPSDRYIRYSTFARHSCDLCSSQLCRRHLRCRYHRRRRYRAIRSLSGFLRLRLFAYLRNTAHQNTHALTKRLKITLPTGKTKIVSQILQSKERRRGNIRIMFNLNKKIISFRVHAIAIEFFPVKISN